MVRQLLDAVPNPWQGMRILSETLETLRARGVSEEQLYGNHLDLIDSIKLDIQQQVNDSAEALFRRKLEQGEISLRIVASADPDLNWELAKTLLLNVSDADRPLLGQDGLPLKRSLFETVYKRDFNTLEENVALYLIQEEAL